MWTEGGPLADSPNGSGCGVVGSLVRFVGEAAVGCCEGIGEAHSFLGDTGPGALGATAFAAAAFASLCALVVKLIFTFFMPDVILSISDIGFVDVSTEGSTVLVDAAGGPVALSAVKGAASIPLSGDFLRTLEVFGASGLG